MNKLALTQTATKIYVYLAFVLFLFFTGFKGYTAIFSAKCTLFTILSVAYVIFCIVFAHPLKKRLKRCDQENSYIAKKLTLGETFALIYLGITAVSALASPYFPKTLTGISRYEGLLTVALYVTVFICISRFGKLNLSSFTILISAVMILQSLVVILQLAGFNVLQLYPKGTNYYIALEKYNGAFISTVGNADISSAFFSLMTPILWVTSFCQKKLRSLTVFSAVLSLFSTLAMSVSAGIVAIAVTLAILPIVLLPQKRKTVITVIAVLLAVLLLAVYFLPLKDGMLFELQSLMKGNFNADFGSGRIHIWSEVIKKARPLLGTGPDTMLMRDIEPFTKTVNGATITRRVDIAHNDFLNIFFHQGIFALTSYLCMLVCILSKWLKNGRKNLYVTALGSGVFAYCVQTFFSFSACSSALFFWIVMGLMNSCSTDS